MEEVDIRTCMKKRNKNQKYQENYRKAKKLT